MYTGRARGGGCHRSTIVQAAGSAAWLIPAQELILPALMVFWLSASQALEPEHASVWIRQPGLPKSSAT
jgi:hypothetical protein